MALAVHQPKFIGRAAMTPFALFVLAIYLLYGLVSAQAAPVGPVILSPADGVVYKTSDLPVVQAWEAVPGATQYRYASYDVDPETTPDAVPVYIQDRDTTNHQIDDTVAEGKYWWRVQAIAPFTSEWSEAHTFTIDNTPPVFAISENSIFNTPSVGVVVAEENIDTITVNGVSTPYVGDKPNYKVTVANEDAYVVAATDKAGNSAAVTFVVDRTAPVITLDTIAAIRVGDDIAAAGTVDDPGVTEAQIYLGDAPIPAEQGGIVPVVGGVFGFIVEDLDAGSYDISATAVDAAGNVGRSPVEAAVVAPARINHLTTIGQDVSPVPFDPSSSAGSPVVIPVISDSASDDEGEVRGIQTLRDSSILSQPAALPTAEGWKLYGLLWYWWLVVASLVVGLWWSIAARRHRMNESSA